MNIEDMYLEFPNLQTPEEIEENDHIMNLPDWYRNKMMNDMSCFPDAEHRCGRIPRATCLAVVAFQLGNESPDHWF